MNLFENSAAKMPCTFSFVDVDKKGVTGKGLRGDTNFMFLLDWLGVFGFSRTTSKEVSVPWINSGRGFCIGTGRGPACTDRGSTNLKPLWTVHADHFQRTLGLVLMIAKNFHKELLVLMIAKNTRYHFHKELLKNS